MSSIVLNTVIFLGSARNIAPAWGGDTRLCDRVANWVKATIAGRNGTSSSCLGDDSTITHQIHIVDPLEVFGPGGALSHSGGELRAPTFFMKADSLPESAKQLQQVIKDADCYLIVSPEYNHTIPPALSSVMGHFGGSNYKCKPGKLRVLRGSFLYYSCHWSDYEIRYCDFEKYSGYCNLLSWSLRRDESCNGDTGESSFLHALICSCSIMFHQHDGFH